MAEHIIFDAKLTNADRRVLENLTADVRYYSDKNLPDASSNGASDADADLDARDEETLSYLNDLNDPQHPSFEPTVFASVDYDKFDWKQPLNKTVIRPYISAARTMVRVETDVVMLTYLILYFTTSVPSALILFFWNFSWAHGLLHFIMQVNYMGSYTLMMHQHIHQRGILQKKYALFDSLFPYVTDPLMGHTWNSYFYHHVKHHHVEGNGPEDLSSTVRYQRDSILHFLHYVGRFLLLIWLDLPLYFAKKGRPVLAIKTAFWELGNYAALYLLYRHNPRATICVFLLPLTLLRLGLMVGNWGQHALVDRDEPDSDYRSSITLIDVPSNRFSFNDGYHTSHHLNPLRHWRDHPNAFMKGKRIYAAQNALVFHNIDYIMLTVKILMKDYDHLARCMVPIGKEQIAMSLEERAAHLKRCTQQFTEEEVEKKFAKSQEATD